MFPLREKREQQERAAEGLDSSVVAAALLLAWADSWWRVRRRPDSWREGGGREREGARERERRAGERKTFLLPPLLATEISSVVSLSLSLSPARLSLSLVLPLSPASLPPAIWATPNPPPAICPRQLKSRAPPPLSLPALSSPSAATRGGQVLPRVARSA